MPRKKEIASSDFVTLKSELGGMIYVLKDDIMYVQDGNSGQSLITFRYRESTLGSMGNQLQKFTGALLAND